MKLVSKKRVVGVVLLLGCTFSPSLLAIFVSDKFFRPTWYFETARKVEEGLHFAFSGAHWMNAKGTPWTLHGLNFQDVEFEGPLNSTLRGWYIPAKNKNPSGIFDSPAVVAVHGAGADRREFLKFAPNLHKANYSVLLFDCREHGISSGSFRGYSFGLREHGDVIYAVKWLKEVQKIRKVAAMGTSQGGVSVILAASKESQIDAVISENPFSSLDDLLIDVIEAIFASKPEWAEESAGPASLLISAGRLVPDWFKTLVRKVIIWKLRLDNSLEGEYINAVDAVSQLHQPLLLMHGTADSLIPHQHSSKIFRHARQPKSLWLAKGSEHTAIFNQYPAEYEQRVLSFLQQHL